MPLTTVLVKSLKTALTRSAGWIVLVGLPGCLLAQALAPLSHGGLPSVGLPLLLSGEVLGSWTAEKISIQGRSFTPAAGACWVDAIPAANDNLILVERHTPGEARGAARVVYYGYDLARGRLDTLRQLRVLSCAARAWSSLLFCDRSPPIPGRGVNEATFYG